MKRIGLWAALLFVALGVQGQATVDEPLPAPRANRHALIIGIGRYADAATPQLPGTRFDRQSATQMAQAMQVPLSNIRYLQDDQATGESIRKSLGELNARVQDGDRVFIHYSGHGTRFNDPASGGCVEALLAYDGGKSGTITNREMASLLQPLARKTDKLFVMYDACHSGGVIGSASPVRTRGFRNDNEEGVLRPKFSAISEECGRPVNVKTRNLLVETTTQGTLPQDIIHISSARDNEISFDDERKGGLATQYMRDCMLRDARDLDGSGAISIDEIKQCAQEKINRRLRNDQTYLAHNITLSGNSAFVPAWFGHAMPTATAQALAPPPLTGEQALRQMWEQRDAKRQVRVKLGKEPLRVGQDTLDFSVQSDRTGYLYVAMAGSDNQSLYLLFPNELDVDNRIEAGTTLQLPRPSWRVRAGGPAGTNHLLVVVSDAVRDLSPLAASKTGPFVSSLNDPEGRFKLGALMTRAAGTGSGSDAYGAAIVPLEEVLSTPPAAQKP
ncbi:MAG TPA: caspase family protein [Burkholderiaceae bacterium]|nr:caspase family protein [Burkholderiaceae bacterium]